MVVASTVGCLFGYCGVLLCVCCLLVYLFDLICKMWIVLCWVTVVGLFGEGFVIGVCDVFVY